MAKCIFCGSTSAPGSKEHVWAQWISRLFYPDPRPDQFITVRQTAAGVGIWEAPLIDVKINCVCKTCNSGWMSALEAAVAPLVTPMILGKPIGELSLADQLTIATWVFKTAIVLEHATPMTRTPFYRFELANAFYRSQTPPNAVHIWLAHYQGTRAAASVVHRRRLRAKEPKRVFESATTTLSVGQFVFQSLALKEVEAANPSLGASLVFDSQWQSLTIPIWPPSHQQVAWTPPKQLDDPLFRAFADREFGIASR